jgi:hypothetical protein
MARATAWPEGTPIEEFNHGKSHRQLLGTNGEPSKHFDQIAYIAPISKDRLEDCDAGVFNYYKYVYLEEPAKVYAPDIPSKDEDDFKKWRTYQMSNICLCGLSCA